MTAELRHLPTSLAIWSRLRTELAEAHGLDENDDVLPDSLDGITDLGDQLVELMRYAVELEAMAEALVGMVKTMQARKDRFLKTSTTIRQHVAEAAREAGIPRLTRPDVTLSFGMTKPALAGEADPDALPDEFVRVKREVNRTAIKAAIDAGREVEGFRLSHGRPSVTVRRS